MKNFLLATALFLVVSCSHQNQKVSFNFFLDDQKSNVGNGAAIDLMVFDDRADDMLLGSKKFSAKEKVKIFSDENIALLLTKKINQNLLAKGFVKGTEKVFEIHIEKLQYQAQRGFPVGSSEGEAAFKVLVKNSKNKSTLTKNFNLKLDSKHFIMPLESTDSATLNSLLQEITQDILGNEELMKALAR